MTDTADRWDEKRGETLGPQASAPQTLDVDLLEGLRVTRNDVSAQWEQNGVLMCSAPASWFDAVIASLSRLPSEEER